LTHVFVFLSLLLGLVATTSAWAGDEIDIERASWSSDRDRLTVRGEDAPDNATVTIRYGENEDNGAVIGTTQADDDGDWEFGITSLDPVPCDVTAQAGGDDDDKEVRRAPNNCSNDGDGGGAPNVPPTANANGPYSGTAGVAVNFSSAGSNDPDGNIASYAWDFGDGAASSTANPSHSYAAAGSYTVTLTVTDNEGTIGSDSTTATITDPDQPPANVPPTANANGPYTGTTVNAVNFSSTGSNDPDGNIVAFSWDFGDGATSNQVNPSHTYTAVGTYTVTLAVTDNDDATGTNETTATITAEPVACTSPIQDHCSITAYTGPEVCVECHEGQARDMHGSVHYQQGGTFPNVTNIPLDFAAAGERPAQAAGDLVATGINTYCGSHENSPRFTCAGCHVGNGRFPMAQSEFELMDPASTEAHAQLANIDCLMCHQEVYKRFPDWTVDGEGFSDLTLLNVTEKANGDLVQEDGAELVRTGFAGIPNTDPTTLDFQFLPAGIDTLPVDVPMAPMALTTLEAAQTVHLTTRKSCLNCHAGAAGADGTKRGDLSKENADPTIAIDMHMSSAGANLTCADCHNETLPDGTGHRVRGRGLDLRPNDVAEPFTCENSGCHTDRPHGDFSNTNGSSRDKHAMKVACQTCHIPSYAKAAVGTEVARDWQDPHPTAAACNGRGGWLPREDKAGLDGESLIPSYAWFDGTSQVYYLGELLEVNGVPTVPTVPLDAGVAASFVGDFNAGDPAYVIGMPNGDVISTSLDTKLHPMKEHWGKLARDDGDNTLIGHSTFEFFRTGSFCRAVAVGLGLDEVNAPTSSVCNGLPGDTEMPPNTTSVAVHTFQTINHGVEVANDALQCGDCHESTARMDLQGDLGYALKGPESQVCTQCHGSEDPMSFSGVHDRHVRREGKDCSVCHTFSRPERGLSTQID
jgi:PKD repeat protein